MTVDKPSELRKPGRNVNFKLDWSLGVIDVVMSCESLFKFGL